MPRSRSASLPNSALGSSFAIPLVLSLFYFSVIISTPSKAEELPSHRGAMSVVQLTEKQLSFEFDRPAEGFSGFFDSKMVRKESTVMQIPLFSFDYGVTEHFSLGANALPFLAVLAGNPAGSLQGRYRFFSSETVSSTLSAYGGLLSTSTRDSTTSMGYLAASLNTTYHFDSYQSFNLHLSSIKFWHDALTTQTSLDLSLDTYATGLGFEKFFSDWFGLETQILFPLNVNLRVEDPTARVSQNFLQSSYYIPYRLIANFKPSRSHLLGLGIMGVAISENKGSWKQVIVPSVNYSVEFN